ncbi:hypothetical protein MRX96_059840 [Rhipicephalus microplus]
MILTSLTKPNLVLLAEELGLAALRPQRISWIYNGHHWVLAAFAPLSFLQVTAAPTWNHVTSSQSCCHLAVLAESLPLLPLPGLDRRCELEGLDASADRAGFVETSVSAGSLRVGNWLLSCFIDVKGVTFMFFKVVDIPRLSFGVLSLTSVAVVAEKMKAVLSAMPLVIGIWSSGVGTSRTPLMRCSYAEFRCCLLVKKNHYAFPWNYNLGVHVASEQAVHLKLPRLSYWPARRE